MVEPKPFVTFAAFCSNVFAAFCSVGCGQSGAVSLAMLASVRKFNQDKLIHQTIMLCLSMHLDFQKADVWSEIVLKNGIRRLVLRDYVGP